jgi:competence protein ComEC
MVLSNSQTLYFLTFLIVIFTLIFSLWAPLRLRFACLILLFFLVGILLDLNKHQVSDIISLANQRARVIIEGTVIQPARIEHEMARLAVKSDRLFIRGKAREIRERLWVTIYKNPREFTPGDKIRFSARLRPFKNFNNPGRYDYELAMNLAGFACAASVSDGRRVVPMGREYLGFPIEILERTRGRIRNFFRENLSPQNQALFGALILGERQGISSELREPFNVAGLGHILAVSGLHIGLVAWLTFAIFNRLLSLSYRLTLQTDIRKLAALMACFPVVAYTCLAGFQVSSQRAMIMSLAYLFAMILGREKEIWSTFAVAAFGVLALDPHSLFSLSFQLSFCAVIGILWLAPGIYKKISSLFNADAKQKRVSGRLYFYFVGLIAVTLSAMIFLLPVISFYFHRVSLVAIPANLTVVPILGLWIIPAGLISAMTLPIFPSLANLCLQLGAWGMEWMMVMIQFWAHFPWAAFWVITPNSYEILLYYSLIFFVFFLKRRTWAKIGLLLTLLLFVVDIFYWTFETRFNPHLKVTYLDVGQGSSALIQFPGKERMLIDGGGFPRDNFDVGKMVVAPFLFHSKIRRIDYLVLTHPQADHMNGLRFIASNFQPKEFWYNGDRRENRSFRELMKIVESKKLKKLLPSDLRGKREISGVKIELLHPLSESDRKQPFPRATELNNNSLVLKISYKGKSLLFPGDLGRLGEEAVISNAGPLLKSDILLTPHHGSRYSGSKRFLQMVGPNICVISSGSGNYFGFPHLETLKRLKRIGCRTIRIDQVGAVQLSVEPNQIKVRSFLQEPF